MDTRLEGQNESMDKNRAYEQRHGHHYHPLLGDKHTTIAREKHTTVAQEKLLKLTLLRIINTNRQRDSNTLSPYPLPK